VREILGNFDFCASEADSWTWEKTIVERAEDLTNWVKLFQQFVAKNLKIFAYANNHYAGHGSGTVSQFWKMWNTK
jgi:hypothetical protein